MTSIHILPETVSSLNGTGFPLGRRVLLNKNKRQKQKKAAHKIITPAIEGTIYTHTRLLAASARTYHLTSVSYESMI